MVRPGDVLHVDHVHRKPMEVVCGLEDAAIFDATALSVAKPAFGHALLTSSFQRGVGGAACAVVRIEPGIQLSVQGPPGQLSGECGNLGTKGFNGHGVRFSLSGFQKIGHNVVPVSPASDSLIDRLALQRKMQYCAYMNFRCIKTSCQAL